jgi:hypothetical protein
MQSSCFPVQLSIGARWSKLVVYTSVHNWGQGTHEDDHSKTPLSCQACKRRVLTSWRELPIGRQSQNRESLAEVSNAMRIYISKIMGIAVW